MVARHGLNDDDQTSFFHSFPMSRKGAHKVEAKDRADDCASQGELNFSCLTMKFALVASLIASASAFAPVSVSGMFMAMRSMKNLSCDDDCNVNF